MSTPACNAPLSLVDLVAYRCGELAAEAEERLEHHLFACAACAQSLDAFTRLEAGIVDLLRAGQVSSLVTGALVARLTTRGARVRSYRLEPGDVVACTAAPDDDFVVVRLALGAAGEPVAMSAEVTNVHTQERSARDTGALAVDKESGDIVFAYAGDAIRAVPRSRWTMHVRVRDGSGERTLGPYTLDHTPWAEREGTGV